VSAHPFLFDEHIDDHGFIEHEDCAERRPLMFLSPPFLFPFLLNFIPLTIRPLLVFFTCALIFENPGNKGRWNAPAFLYHV